VEPAAPTATNLAWSPTPEATSYLVIVFTTDRSWTWEGEGTQVLVADVTSGVPVDDACWAVLSSADGDLIGASRLHAVGDDRPCALGGVDGRGVTSTP
jgi:hypothetical protein